MLANSKLFTANSAELNSESYERFAIYYVPAPNSKLAEFGQVWFGSDKLEDDDIRIFGLDKNLVSDITAKPARYGLHATLKAPFHLAEGFTLKKLLHQAKCFASNRKSFSLGKLKQSWVGNTMILAPEGNGHQINQFASQCVLGFEDFRAPLTMKERTRRMETGHLSLHQRLMLEELGYPYVLSEFKFHITLTRSLSEEDKEVLLPKLSPVLEHICSEPCLIDGIAVVGDPGNNKPFEVIQRFSLSG
ncbi:MAG: DUF1045 domain-containing protein [Methyloligellaceae bacterium]